MKIFHLTKKRTFSSNYGIGLTIFAYLRNL